MGNIKRGQARLVLSLPKYAYSTREDRKYKKESGGQDAHLTREENTRREVTRDLLYSMQEPSLKTFYRRLPHWELDGATYFITFNTWEKLELSPEARKIVFNSCLFFNNQRYKLFVFVVMTDHVHLLMQPLIKSENEYWSLSTIMKSIKGFSAKQIPKVMQHIGIVWQDERYDRIVRNEEEFQAFWQYIRQNPVEAKLSLIPEDYPFFWQASE